MRVSPFMKTQTGMARRWWRFLDREEITLAFDGDHRASLNVIFSVLPTSPGTTHAVLFVPKKNPDQEHPGQESSENGAGE